MSVHYEVESPNGVSHLIVGDGPCSTCGFGVASHHPCPMCGAGFRQPCRVNGYDVEPFTHRERRLLHARWINELERAQSQDVG